MFETAAIGRFLANFVSANMVNAIYREAGTALTVRMRGRPHLHLGTERQETKAGVIFRDLKRAKGRHW